MEVRRKTNEFKSLPGTDGGLLVTILVICCINTFTINAAAPNIEVLIVE